MKKYITKKKAILLLTVLALYVVIITPLLIINLQKQQELRGKAAITATAPASHWKFNETSGTTASDSSGNNNTGTLVNGPVWTTGKVGNGLSFDGVNDYVNVANSSSLNITGNQITIEAWIYPKSLTETYIVSKFGEDVVTSGYNLLITASNFYFRLGNGTARYQLAQPHGMSVNTWYHVVAVYNGTTMKIYKNGVALSGSTAFTGNIAGNSNSVNIGQRIDNLYRWNGLLDEVRIYNTALSAAEILQHYNDENSPATPTPTPASTTPTPTPVPPISTCSVSPTDSIVIVDVSSSMNQTIDNSSTTKLAGAKIAAKEFVDIISADTRNKTGLVSFATLATLNSPLTNNYASVKTLIDSLTIPAEADTCHECAVNKANQEITANGRTNIKKVAVFLTDGGANRIDGNPNQVPNAEAEQKALEAVTAAYNANKISFYTIGLGSGVHENFLRQIANMTGGKYYYSPTVEDLQAIYREIAGTAGQGTINGFVFNDANNNQLYDSGESKLSGWDVKLSSPSGTQTFTTDSTGSYAISELCDGSYTLSEVLQSGWQQTVPADPNGYSITISNGNSFTDKIFGNIVSSAPTSTPVPTQTLTPTPTPASATPTPTTVATSLEITVYHHGIWNSGDNTNPTGTSLSNKNPIHKTINAKLELFNTNNKMIASGSGSIKYASSSGNFKGIVSVYPNTFPSGKYYLKIKTPYHLRRLVPGILNIIAGQKNTVPAATLITGDANNDNKLNILDYNLLIGCYSDLTAATSCNDSKKIATDFNDDSFVNQIDYNLFLREIATQPGE